MDEKIEDRIIKNAEDFREELIGLTQELIRIPSENKPPLGNEKECQEFIATLLRDIGLEVDIFTPEEVNGLESHPAYFGSRKYRDRPNVVGKLKGYGRSLILGGHIDTVARGKKPWRHNPFGGITEDGRIYGRGALDMKGGIAAAIMAIKCLLDIGFNGNLIFESVVDEEFAGANGTLACIQRGYKADAAIISEPTYLKIHPAHRGLRIAHITIRTTGGVPLASSNLVNPSFKVADFISAISEFEQKRQLRAKENSFYPLYSKYEKPVPLMITKIRVGDLDPTSPLSMPDECFLEVFWETMPRERKEDVEKEFLDFLKTTIDEDDWFKKNPPKIDFWLRYLPGSHVNSTHPIIKTLEKSYQTCTGKTSEIIGAPFPCDLFMYNLYSNTPAIIFGPGGGNAHASDEFVNIEDLIATTKILALTTVSWCENDLSHRSS